MIMRLRRFGTHSLAALALAGLSTSTPAQTIQVQDESLSQTESPGESRSQDEGRLEALVEIVAAAEDPVLSYASVGQGEASYYGHELAGNRTASGERFNPQAMTAAHRSLPLGTKLRVTNLSNGRSVMVRVNDRGPFARGRILDLSLGAAHKIGMVRAGSAKVKLEVLRPTS
jgi:rare lipoprotein A